MINARGLWVVILSGVALVAVCIHARAADCPPYVPPSQVNCDEARGYVAAKGLVATVEQARACGYRLSDIVRTIRRCGLK